MTAHLKQVHEGLRPYKCGHEGCDKAFFAKLERDYHKLRHEDGVKKHVCSLCGKRFRVPVSLSRHLLNVHDQHPTKQRESYTCTFPGCNKVLRWKALRRHLETHKSPEERRSCPTCNEVFPNMQMRVLHERSVHQGKTNFKCEQCGKLFRDQIALNMHYKTHSSEQPFQCEKCGKRFKYKGSHLSHAKAICGTDEEEMERIRKAKRAAELRNWKRERNFTCKTCGHKFISEVRLEDHLRRVHNEVVVRNYETGINR